MAGERGLTLAAIDIGTNSIHMVISRATGQGIEVVDREREVTQVGRGSFVGGRLRAEAVNKTLDALARFARLARSHQVDRILCTATAAVREATNAGRFVREARRLTGVTPRLIPADEEGRFNYLAIRSSLALGEDTSLIIDIGGGSMQLVACNAQKLLRVRGAPLGALRLTERFLTEDPPSKRSLGRLQRHIRKTAKPVLESMLELSPKPRRVYGSSGAIHALAQAAAWRESGSGIEQLNGYFFSLASLNRLVKDLEKMPYATRDKLKGLDARRAEIVLPGALVLAHVIKAMGADGITLSDASVREGLVLDYVARHGKEIEELKGVDDLQRRSVLRLLAKFGEDGPHPRHVAKLSLTLFDGLAYKHDLGEDARRLLEHAALLHDIGNVIGHDDHAAHSLYIIKNGNLRGFSPEETELIANVARYHGKKKPRKRDDSMTGLDKRQRKLVKWLAAILRIAEALDRSQYQLVDDVIVVRQPLRLTIYLRAKADVQLELWATRRRVALLESLLKREVRVARERRVSRSEAKARAARREGDPAMKPAPPAGDGSPPEGRRNESAVPERARRSPASTPVARRDRSAPPGRRGPGFLPKRPGGRGAR
jgi:exopolyphosphatase/guanosine-5'-triphosphate,3'-diphosphate pyrophosphatase